MTTVRVLLAALLVGMAATVQAAPAPLPRPDRSRPTETQLLGDLWRMGVLVDLSVGFRPGTWVATIWLPGRKKDGPPSLNDLVRVVKLEAKDRRTALRAIRARMAIELSFPAD
jgi:hypothetical protein